MTKIKTGWLGNLEIKSSSNTIIDITFTPFPNDCYVVIPIIRGGINFSVWVNTVENGKAQIMAISTSNSTLTGRSIQWIAIGY